MRKPHLSRGQRRALILVLLIGAAWVAWGRLTAPRGVQRVAFVPASESCGSEGRLTYCIYRAAGGTNGDIVYHLHGRNLDARVWNDDTYWTAMVQAAWQRAKVRPPTVVSLSYGPTWLLVPKGERADSGLLDDLQARLPQIEARIEAQAGAQAGAQSGAQSGAQTRPTAGGGHRRMLVGESMGGLNVLIAGLSQPSSFAKVAALCPGVYADSPFGSWDSLRAALKRTGADPKIGLGVWWLARRYVANEAEWQRVSPLALMARARRPFPALYLSNGLYDAYGNFEGSQQLADLAARRGASVEWHPLYGGHCAIDVPSLARFLVS